MNNASFEKYDFKDLLCALFVTLFIFILGAGFLTKGAIYWGDDFAAYISEGISIAEGTFDQQQKINYFYHPSPLPEEAADGTLVYVWGYPLLQAVVYKLVGFDFQSIIFYKIPALLGLALTGGCLVLFFCRRFSLLVSVFLSVIFCMSGDFLDAPETMYADVPFLFFSMLVLLLMEMFTDEVVKNKPVVLTSLAAGAAMWMTYETRLNGIAICLAAFLGFVISSFTNKVRLKQSWKVLFPYIVMGILVFVSEHFWLAPATANLSDFLQKSEINTLEHYTFLLSAYFSTLFGIYIPHSGLVLLAVGILGMATRGWKNNLYLTILTVGTFLVVINLPYVQGLRYLYQTILFVVMYIAYGFQFIGSGIMNFCTKVFKPGEKTDPNRMWQLISTTVLCMILIIASISPVFRSIRSFERRDEKGQMDVYSDEAIEVYNYIQNHVPYDEVIAFAKPRALYLNTGHISMRPDVNGHKLEDADYYLYTKFDFPDYEQPDLQGVVKKAVVDNDAFTLYRLD